LGFEGTKNMNDKSHRLALLDEKLRDVCKRLDDCVKDIIDIPLEPRKDMKLKIGTALTQIYDVFDAIYVHRPDLKPEWLDSESKLQ
jgi:hypothetical protein